MFHIPRISVRLCPYAKLGRAGNSTLLSYVSLHFMSLTFPCDDFLLPSDNFTAISHPSDRR